MTERECGTCTACCEGWLTSPVIPLFPGRGCPHRTAQGCGIYETRPDDPCRDFICGWLQKDSPIPDEMRPDKSGVIVMLNRKYEGWTVIKAIPVGQSIPEASQRWLMQYAQAVNTPLLLMERLMDGDKYIGKSLRGFGPPSFRQVVENSIDSQDVFKMQGDGR